MKKLLLFLLFFPLFIFAQDEWEHAGTDSENSKYYIKDITKKKYSSDIIFWVKIIDANKIVKTKKGNTTKKGQTSLQHWVVNCDDKTILVDSITKYDSAGKVLWSDRGNILPEPAVPDSVGEAVLLQACSYISE